jgi:hypothetical protein
MTDGAFPRPGDPWVIHTPECVGAGQFALSKHPSLDNAPRAGDPGHSTSRKQSGHAWSSSTFQIRLLVKGTNH